MVVRGEERTMIYLKDEATGVTVEDSTVDAGWVRLAARNMIDAFPLQVSPEQAEALLRGLLLRKMHSLPIGDDRKCVSHFIVWLEDGAEKPPSDGCEMCEFARANMSEDRLDVIRRNPLKASAERYLVAEIDRLKARERKLVERMKLALRQGGDKAWRTVLEFAIEEDDDG